MEYRAPPSLDHEAAAPAPSRLRAGGQGAWTFDSLQFGGVTPPRVRPPELPSYLSNNDQVQDARSGGTDDFVPKVIGVEDQWDALLQIVKKVDASMESMADGRAAGHTHAARMEAATKLIHNHTKVLNDIANPSFHQNIEGKALTQVNLVRVETFRSHYVDQCLREVACRLLGRQPGVHQLKVRLSPSNQAQLKVWTQTTTYLDGRIQSVDEEMPGRKPDMSPEAAAAMRDVLSEVGELGVTMAVAAGAPAWASFRRILETDGGFDSEADGAAARHSHDAREGAARKLIHNHDRVLRDIINPSLLRQDHNPQLHPQCINRTNRRVPEPPAQLPTPLTTQLPPRSPPKQQLLSTKIRLHLDDFSQSPQASQHCPPARPRSAILAIPTPIRPHVPTRHGLARGCGGAGRRCSLTPGQHALPRV